MGVVLYWGISAQPQQGESVLDALLREGASLSYSCKGGSCGSCTLRAIEGTPPTASQNGLQDTWKARGCSLACACRVDQDLTVCPVGFRCTDLRSSPSDPATQ